MQKTNLLIFGCIFFLALGACGMAQGMMGRSGGVGTMWNGGVMGGMGGSGATGSDAAMNGAAMGMSNGAVTVGDDGTLYVLSRVLPQSSQGALPSTATENRSILLPWINSTLISF